MSARIQQIYIAMFGRPADPLGLAFWNSQTNNGANLAPIINALSGTPEYQARFAGLSSAQLVNSIYQSLFGRDADLAGLTFFTNQLASGRQSLASIAVNILDGAQGTDLARITNKTTAATNFTNALDTAAEILAYGASAVPAAQAYLAGVTDQASTIPTTAQTDTAVADIVASGGGTPGQTFTLTTNIDGGTAFTGTGGNDVYNGAIVGDNATGSTLNPGDNLNGLGGTDTLNVNISGALGGGSTAAGFTLAGVERVVVSNFETSANNNTLDMSGATGLTKLGLSASSDTGDTIFTNVKNIVAAEMSNGAGDLTITYAGVTLTGTTDAQSLALNNVTGGAFSAGGGFEVFNVVTSGTKSTLTTLNVGTPTSGTQTVNISGTADLTITDTLATTVKVVNASTMTGSLSVALDNVDSSVTGGAGNDSFNFGGNLTTADTVDGGAGTDRISLTSSLSATMSKISNVEILRMGGNGQTYDVTKIAGLTGYEIFEAGAGSPTSIIVNGLATGQTVTVLEDTTTATTLNVATAAADLTVKLDNSISKETNGVDVAQATLGNVKTLTINSVGGNLAATVSNDDSNSFDVGTAAALTKIIVTGDTALSLDATPGAALDGALLSTITTVDASAFTANLYVLGSNTASTLTGGSGNDSIVGGSAADSIVGGAGNDTLTGGGGNDNIAGGDGNDTITLAAASSATGAVVATGGAGADVITMESATGVFNVDGGEGDDRVVVGSGGNLHLEASDTVVGGAGTDRLQVNGSNGANYNFATNSAVLQNVSGFEGVKIDVSTLGNNNNHTTTLTFNDILIAGAGGTLDVVAQDAATPGANAGVDITIDASGVLLSSSKVVFTGTADVQYIYKVGNATESVTLNQRDDTVSVSNVAFLAAADTIAAGSGTDTLTLAYDGTSGTAVALNTTTLTNITGFEQINLDGVTGNGTGAITFTLTDAFAQANRDLGTNTLTVNRTRADFTTIDDTGTTKIDASGVTTVVLSLSGASGADTITGGAMNDTINGNDGIDVLNGGAGNDTINGGAAGDQITGGDGADVIVGGTGADSVTLTETAAARDIVRFSAGQFGDTITGFQGGSAATTDQLGFATTGLLNTIGAGGADAAVTVQVVSDATTAAAANVTAVIVQGAIATAADTTTVAAFLDPYLANPTYTAGDSLMFVVNVSDGNARVYNFVDNDGNNVVASAELSLVATLVGVTTEQLVAGNIVGFA